MYNIKVYEKNGTTLKDTIKVEKLEKVSTFTSQVNGGFGVGNIGLAYKITNTDIAIGDIVKVQYKSDIIYIGSALTVKKLYGKDREIITLNLIGLGSLLSLLLTTSIYSAIASDIVKDLIDDFNIEYGSNILSYDANSIPPTIGTLDLDFSSYKSYFQAIEETAQAAGLFFFIDLDGKVYLDEKANFTSHTLTVGDDIDELKVDEDSKELINSLWLTYNGGTKEYIDATSQSTYGKREKYLDKSSELSNVDTADIYGANYIAQYKDEVKKVSIIVNNEYDFYSIKGGDLINVRNVGYVINNLQVAKITYGLEKATIELERSYSFAKEVFIG